VRHAGRQDSPSSLLNAAASALNQWHLEGPIGASIGVLERRGWTQARIHHCASDRRRRTTSDFDSGSLDLRARKGNRFVLLRQSLVGIVAVGPSMVCLSVVGCCSIWCLPLAPWQSRRCCWSWSSCDEGTVYDESADDHKPSFVLGAISYCNSVSPWLHHLQPYRSSTLPLL